MTRRDQRYAMSLIGLSFILLFAVVSCYSNPPGGGPQKSPAVKMALNAPTAFPNREAGMKNDEGVGHLVQEHWDTSATYFRDAIAMSPNMAEAHFNLGLALDQMGNHPEASEHFKLAQGLAPDNPKIAENEILKKHL